MSINNNREILRYVAIEIPINATGQNNFPDQSQLRGAIIQSVELLTPDVASVSPITQNSTIAPLADLQKSTVSFVQGSDVFAMNMPILGLNPNATPNGSTPYKLERELFSNRIIDWNQCYIRIEGSPNTVGEIVSLGIYYFWPNNTQPKPY
jgi:hypothetical protein